MIVRLITNPEEMRSVSERLRTEGRSISLVPTMGCLHQGHLSLFSTAKQKTDTVVVSIFVNPKQFAPGEDYRDYPRDVKRDDAIAKQADVDFIFHPRVEDMYPQRYSTYVEVKKLQDVLCGAFRPGHFRGVATVCLKLFNIVRPHVVVFGQKDAQQAVIIRRMIRDLNLPLELIVAATRREPDGLAISSRNRYLSEEERTEAAVLYEALEQARKLVRAGERSSEKIKAEIIRLIKGKPLAKLEYVDIVDTESLKSVDLLQGEILIALACWFGKARLIDNLSLRIPFNEQS